MTIAGDHQGQPDRPTQIHDQARMYSDLRKRASQQSAQRQQMIARRIGQYRAQRRRSPQRPG